MTIGAGQCFAEIAELRHRDASKREGRRDPLQCAERITRCEGTRRGSDQRVHQNPATLMTNDHRVVSRRLVLAESLGTNR